MWYGNQGSGEENATAKCKATPAPLKCKTTTAPEKSAEDYQSSIARHLVDRSDCANCYVDSSFSVLCFGRSKRHLEVLEAVCILSSKKDLCAQKYNLAATFVHPPDRSVSCRIILILL